MLHASINISLDYTHSFFVQVRHPVWRRWHQFARGDPPWSVWTLWHHKVARHQLLLPGIDQVRSWKPLLGGGHSNIQNPAPRHTILCMIWLAHHDSGCHRPFSAKRHSRQKVTVWPFLFWAFKLSAFFAMPLARIPPSRYCIKLFFSFRWLSFDPKLYVKDHVKRMRERTFLEILSKACDVRLTWLTQWLLDRVDDFLAWECVPRPQADENVHVLRAKKIDLLGKPWNGFFQVPEIMP